MTDNQNCILVISRFQLCLNSREKDLEKITVADVQPHLSAAAHAADVTIIKDGSRFSVLKHRFMMGVNGFVVFHISSLPKIMFAR
jgi:hypothetical protein